MSLSLRTSLIIGFIAVLISSLVAMANFQLRVQQASAQGRSLVLQIAKNAQGTSSIASYLLDQELATEIVEGLNGNDLVAGAQISTVDEILASEGKMSDDNIIVNLANPFDDSEVTGRLEVNANMRFIQSQAASTATQTAITLIGLSALIAIIVGIFVNLKLTGPLRQLSRAFEKIDTDNPAEMTSIDVRYTKRDEIGSLVGKTNALIQALQSRFSSEKQLLESTQELQKRFRLLFEQATAGIALITAESKVSISNPSFRALFDGQVDMQPFPSLFTEEREVHKKLKVLTDNPSITQLDAEFSLTRNGERRYLHCLFSRILDSRQSVRNEDDILIEVIIYDVTDRKQTELKARYEADHDSLTGLMNRRSGKESLSRLLKEADSSSQTFALMMIDLDKFKPINDTYGHDAGDIVLRNVSEGITTLLAAHNGILVRWGGDEFLLGIRASDEAQLQSFAADVLTRIQQDIYLDGETKVNVGASIGGIVCHGGPENTRSIDALIKQSDELMYKIKGQGRNHFVIQGVKSVPKADTKTN